MKIDRHKIYGDVKKPASFNALISDISAPSGKYHHRVWMWRGQSNIDWRLDSSAYRRLAISTSYKRKDINKALFSYEEDLLQQATHRGFRFENGRNLTDFELLAKLQHHGAATRLVDFTRSVLVGLWFACNGNPKSSGLLIGFDTWYLGGYEKELEIRTYQEIIDDLDEKIPFTWEPPGVSPRVAVQHSQFIYSIVSEHKRGSLIFPDKGGFRLFKITPSLKKECLEILKEVFDIESSIMFPDIDGFAGSNSVNEDIGNMHRW